MMRPVTLLLFAMCVAGAGRVVALREPECFEYEPGKLRVIAQGPAGWRVSAGGERGWLLATEADANHALRIARSFTKCCRLPSLSQRGVQYWEGVGPSPLGPVSEEPDCLRYAPDLLTVTKSPGQFNVIAGASRLVALGTPEDAAVALKSIRRASYHCFIGRGNKKANRLAYIFEYWR